MEYKTVSHLDAVSDKAEWVAGYQGNHFTSILAKLVAELAQEVKKLQEEVEELKNGV